MRGEKAIEYVIDLVKKTQDISLDLMWTDKQAILWVLEDLLADYYGKERDDHVVQTDDSSTENG